VLYIDPRFLDLGTSWRWVVSFTPRPLNPRGTHWIGGWVGPKNRSGRRVPARRRVSTELDIIISHVWHEVTLLLALPWTRLKMKRLWNQEDLEHAYWEDIKHIRNWEWKGGIDKILSGYQSCQLKIAVVSGTISGLIVRIWCPRHTLMMGTEMVPETWVKLYRIHRIFLDFFHRPVLKKNTTFRKLDLFTSSGEGGGEDTYSDISSL
jgi:hypothetical protein